MLVIYGGEDNVPDGMPTDEEIKQLLANMGITQIPYEEYASIDVNQEFGSLILKN